MRAEENILPAALDAARMQRLALSSIVTGIVFGWLAPSSTGPGVFIPLTAAIAGICLLAGGAFPRSRVSQVYLMLGALLLFVPVVWAAEWVTVLAVFGACGLAALSLRDPDTWGSFIKAGTGPLGRLPFTPVFLARSLGRYGERLSRSRGLLRGAAIAIPLVLLFGVLFASADAVFANTVDRFFTIDLGEIPARVAAAAFGTALTLAFAMSSTNLKQLWPGPIYTGSWGPLFDRAEDNRPIWRLGETEWTIALVALDALFMAFVAIQITVLFAGHEHVLATAGLTYSEYARTGFFQLLVTGGLTLGVVAMARFWARTSTPALTVRLNVLLLVLCTMTLVILASAFRRMTLYEQAYGYTRPRYVVYTIIIWMAGIFVATMITQPTRLAPHLPRIAAIFSGLAIVMATGIGPDAFIASANVDRYERTGKIDTAYLATLSPDALTAISRLPAQLRQCPTQVIASRYGGQDHWASFNLSRARWRDRIPMGTGAGPRDPYECAVEESKP